MLIEQLTEICLDKSPIHLPLSEHASESKALVPLIGLETGSVRMAKQIMPSKGVPFPIEEWPSVLVHGLEVLNENNWFPAMTLIIGSPGETDEDVKATLDLIYEVERRGLFAFFIPSIFTPLHDTRMETKKGVTETRELTPLQWQLMMKCWKMNLRPGQVSWWAPMVWRTRRDRALGVEAAQAQRPRTSPGRCSCSPAPCRRTLMAKMGKIYLGRPLNIKTRKELLATIKPHQHQFLRPDTGDMPDTPAADKAPAPSQRSYISLVPTPAA